MPVTETAVASHPPRELPRNSTMSALRGLAAEGQFPVTIFLLLEQMGGFARGGALSRTGCVFEMISGLRYRHPGSGFDCSAYGDRAQWVSEAAGLDYSVGVSFPVNGMEGAQWIVAVTYEPGDLYRVWLWAKRHAATGARKLLMGPVEACDSNLIEVIDEVYVDALRSAGLDGIPDVDHEVAAD